MRLLLFCKKQHPLTYIPTTQEQNHKSMQPVPTCTFIPSYLSRWKDGNVGYFIIKNWVKFMCQATKKPKNKSVQWAVVVVKCAQNHLTRNSIILVRYSCPFNAIPSIFLISGLIKIVFSGFCICFQLYYFCLTDSVPNYMCMASISHSFILQRLLYVRCTFIEWYFKDSLFTLN